MLEVVRVTVAPKKELIGVVNAGLAALCNLTNFPEAKAKRLQLATEELFLYALSTIRQAGLKVNVTVRFRHHAHWFQIVVEYPGPRGAMDKHLNLGHARLRAVKNFESLGLCLAESILDTLTAQYWTQEGITSYVLSLQGGGKE